MIDQMEVARLLEDRRGRIVEQVVSEMLTDSFWTERFGQGINQRLLADIDLNIAILIKAVRYRSPMIIEDHMLWRRNLVVPLGCSSGRLRETFARIWNAVAAQLPDWAVPAIHSNILASMQAIAYTSASSQSVVAVHDQLAEDLVAATYDQHWHWQAAYSDVGRQGVSYDAWFFIDYVNDALGYKQPDLAARQARWQRDRNYQRGLCTTHMQQWLWLLSEICERRLPPAAAAEVRQALETSSSFLPHDSEPNRALLAVQDRIVSEVAQHLVAQGLAAHPDQAAMEIGWYMAYLGDSLARKSPDLLRGYTRWMQHWLASQGLPDTPLRQSYAALNAALSHYLPEYAARDACAIIQASQSAL
jgi:hypothetical protein